MSPEYRLENWYLVEDLDGGIRLRGAVYDNPRFIDGEIVTTSRLAHVVRNGAVVVTASGSLYRLGTFKVMP